MQKPLVLLTSDSMGSSLPLIFHNQHPRRRNIFLQTIRVTPPITPSFPDHFLEFDFDNNENEDNSYCAPMKKRTRTSWTNEEETWIMQWISQYVKGSTSEKRIQWITALKDIRSTGATHIFAEDHLSTSKLMECAKRLAKKTGVHVHKLTPPASSSASL